MDLLIICSSSKSLDHLILFTMLSCLLHINRHSAGNKPGLFVVTVCLEFVIIYIYVTQLPPRFVGR